MIQKASIVILVVSAMSAGSASASAALRGGAGSNSVSNASRSLGQVMCPVDQPTDASSCPHNKNESCQYEDGTLNFGSKYDTTCSCENLLGSSANIYKWTCDSKCPSEKPTEGDQCNSYKNESCIFDEGTTDCSCEPMVGNNDGVYEWVCNEQCPTDTTAFMDSTSKPKQCYHSGQSCEDNYCLTCTCTPLMGNTEGVMMWDCEENGNCHV